MIDKLKVKYDKIFDDIFFSKEFKDFIIEKFGYCPNGLTLDTDVENGKPEFTCRCKKYGYDYPSADRVIGDYRIENPPSIDLEKYIYEMFKYLKNNYPILYDDIYEYDFYTD